MTTPPMTTPRPRLLGTALFTVVFTSATALLMVPAAVAGRISPRAVQAVAHLWTRIHRAALRTFCGIDVALEGAIGPEGPREPVLYAMKHESMFEALDAPVLFQLPVVFAKVELMRLPLWGRAAAAYGLVAVDRDGGAATLRQMLAAAKAAVAAGRPLVIFPEGTRVPHGEAPPLQSGFAGLYKLLGLPVVPVAVDSGPLYRRRWKRPGTIRYRFGEAIPPGLPRAQVEARVHAAINALNRETTDG